jgi:hypothetical protein
VPKYISNEEARTRVGVLMENDSKTTQIMSNFGSCCGVENISSIVFD